MPDRWEQHGAQDQRKQRDPELHGDGRLPVLPAAEEPAWDGGPTRLRRVKELAALAIRHRGHIAGLRAIRPGAARHPSALRHGVAIAVADAITVDGSVGADHDQRQDRAEVGDRRRRRGPGGIRVDVGGEEQAKQQAAGEQDKGSAIGGDRCR